jgi:hypothetical protein
MEVEGIVLAGGRSSRIGEDKSFLQYKGRSLVEWAIQVLSDLSVPIALVRNADQDFSSLDVSCWPDERPELGPLGGLYTGLRRSRARKLFVLPCDLPLMEPGLFPADRASLLSERCWMRESCALSSSFRAVGFSPGLLLRRSMGSLTESSRMSIPLGICRVSNRGERAYSSFLRAKSYFLIL